MGHSPPDDARGVYGISVAAELVGMGVQTLRLYETRGLVEPERTDGGTRRYSANDLERIRRIGDLLTNGLNLAGISMVLNLEAENTQLRSEQENAGWPATAPVPSHEAEPNTSTNTAATAAVAELATAPLTESHPRRRAT